MNSRFFFQFSINTDTQYQIYEIEEKCMCILSSQNIILITNVIFIYKLLFKYTLHYAVVIMRILNLSLQLDLKFMNLLEFYIQLMKI